MPKRLLREGILESRAVNSLSEAGEILYRRLMSIVDDYGRFEADPDLIRARCFPLQLERWPTSRVTSVFTELHRDSPLVTVYYGGDKTYFQINKFNQRLQAKSRYPSPVLNGDPPCSTVLNGDPPCSTVLNGDPPPRASRARTEAEAEAESKAEAEATARAVPPLPLGEFPKTAEAVRKVRPSCEDPFILRLAQTAIQGTISVGNGSTPDITDAVLAQAVDKAFSDNPKARSGLLLTMVPQILKTWVTQSGSPLHPAPAIDPSKAIPWTEKLKEFRRH